MVVEIKAMALKTPVLTNVGQIDEDAAIRAGIRAVRILMKRNAADLDELARHVAEGAVKHRVGQIMNLHDAKQAQELSELEERKERLS